jgi:hypothetical protein
VFSISISDQISRYRTRMAFTTARWSITVHGPPYKGLSQYWLVSIFCKNETENVKYPPLATKSTHNISPKIPHKCFAPAAALRSLRSLCHYLFKTRVGEALLVCENHFFKTQMILHVRQRVAFVKIENAAAAQAGAGAEARELHNGL